MSNTRDLSQFGYRELEESAKLLTAYTSREHDKTERLTDGIAIEFNPNSGNVFLVDEDFNVAMMNGDDLEDFYSCPECGNEGFKDDMKNGEKCCKEYAGVEADEEE